MNIITEEFIKKNYDIIYKNYFLGFSNLNIHSKYIIGNAKKCRFCGKIYNKTFFSDIAHAIPQSIGNDLLFLNEECDKCNHFFGEGIETNFDKIVKPYRSFYHIRGKNGIPSLKSKDKASRVDFNEKDKISVIQEKKNHPKIYEDKKNKIISYHVDIESYVPVAVYKALVKMAISIMEEKYLKYFQQTIIWLLDENHNHKYMTPLKIIKKFHPGPLDCPTPIIYLYFNKDFQKNDYPYSIFVLILKNIEYQIMVPSIQDRESNKKFILPIFLNDLDKNNIYGQSTYEILDYSNPGKVTDDYVPINYSYGRREVIDLKSADNLKKMQEYIKLKN